MAASPQRFTRTLAALEAFHTNELHAQTRISHESRLQGDAAEAHAAVLRHACAAKEAKLQCQLDAVRSQAVHTERALAERTRECEALRARAEAAERRAVSSEATLGREVNRLEGDHYEVSMLLKQFSRAHELKSEHLSSLQEQTAKANSLVAHMQENASHMAKRLAAHQRKTMKLQESQHLLDATAKAWGAERKQLLLQAATAEQSAREAALRVKMLEEQNAALVGEFEAERHGNLRSLRQTREVSAASDASLRGEVRALGALKDALLADACQVRLRSGSVCTVGQYVRAVYERQQRHRRGGGGPPFSGGGTSASASDVGTGDETSTDAPSLGMAPASSDEEHVRRGGGARRSARRRPSASSAAPSVEAMDGAAALVVARGDAGDMGELGADGSASTAHVPSRMLLLGGGGGVRQHDLMRF